LFKVPDDCIVHATPSGDVRIVPRSPTVTNCVPDQATPNIALVVVVFEVCKVHAVPVGDLRMVPFDPTATNCVPDQTIPDRFAPVPEACIVQVVTVSAVEPDMFPDVAVIVVEPLAPAVAFPLEPEVLLIGATPISDDVQITNDVISCVVLSENVPMAVNCWVAPMGMTQFIGVTARDTSIAGVTVNVVVPEMFLNFAVIVVEPAPAPLASPAVLIVALVVSEDDQITCAVKSWVLLSENVPVAVNCCVVPFAMLGLVGVTLIELIDTAAGVIVNVNVSLLEVDPAESVT
jgi:hypothetical protein